MTRIDRSKTPDSQVQQVLDILAKYEQIHPDALIEARRTGYDFIHIRIMDPDFQPLDRIEREEKVWPILDQLSDEILSDIMGLTLVTPEEAPYSGSSIEFDHPLPTLPVPNLWEIDETEVEKYTNGAQKADSTSLNGTIMVPLSLSEVSTLQKTAHLQGLSDGDLVREWVLEKLAVRNNNEILSASTS